MHLENKSPDYGYGIEILFFLQPKNLGFSRKIFFQNNEYTNYCMPKKNTKATTSGKNQ
jgi:hypothetical protein